jgi:hypothetical protein
MQEVINEAEAAAYDAPAPLPVPAQAEPAGPVSEPSLAPRAVVEA